MWKVEVVVVFLICVWTDIAFQEHNIGVGAFSTVSLLPLPHHEFRCKTTSIRRWVHCSSMKDETDNGSASEVALLDERPTVQVVARPLGVLELSPSVEEDHNSSPMKLDEKETNSPQFSIWAARGLLLLVAAIWGTNFAVR
jgi:hypothetical protein